MRLYYIEYRKRPGSAPEKVTYINFDFDIGVSKEIQFYDKQGLLAILDYLEACYGIKKGSKKIKIRYKIKKRGVR